MIRAEAVEAAALALHERHEIKGVYVDDVRRILEAAAPYMLAGLRTQLMDYRAMLIEQSKDAEVFGAHATGVGIAIRLLDEISGTPNAR